MSVNYTLADADKTILYRAPVNSDLPNVTLWDVYQRFEQGQNLMAISTDMPEVPKNKLLLARAFFASVNPQAYASSTVTPLRVLVDENIDAHIVTDTARKVFGHATHVSFVGLAYKRDVDVYAYALKHRINLIASKDLALIKSRATWDLTRCAHEFFQWRLNAGNNTTGEYIARLPRILHVMGANLSGEDIAQNFENNHRHVGAIFDEAASPTIQLHRDGAKPGKHLFEFVEDGRFHKLKDMRDHIVGCVMNEFGMADTSTKSDRHVAAMIKRVVEHEMHSQSRQPFYHKLSDVLKKESVFRAIVETAEPLQHSDSLTRRIDDYRTRGIHSVFNPEANLKGKKALGRDPLSIPLVARFKRFKATGEIIITGIPRRPLVAA